MSELGERPSGEDELVLVFRPPENPAAQVAVNTPFKGHRVRLDEILDWFKVLKVDSIELWIEGAQGRLEARRNSFSRQRARLGQKSLSSHTLKLYQRNFLLIRSEALLPRTHQKNLSKTYLRTSPRDKPRK